MKNSISIYISELLFLHDCVILPDFGGFIASNKPASLNSKTGELSPPFKELMFNTTLKTNDGLLLSYIVEKEKISHEEVLERILLYSKGLNEKLTSSKILRIDKVGLFTLGEEGNIIFTQDNKINYNLSSFGMTSSFAAPIKRQKEIEKQITTTIVNLKEQASVQQLFLRAAAILLPLITISYLSITQQDRIHSVYTQMANMNPFVKKINIINNATSPKKDVIITSPIIQTQKYYLIAGSFLEEENANRMLLKLRKWGHDAEILKNDKRIRVAYSEYVTREDALISLNEIRKNNPSAWLLTQ